MITDHSTYTTDDTRRREKSSRNKDARIEVSVISVIVGRDLLRSPIKKINVIT